MDEPLPSTHDKLPVEECFAPLVGEIAAGRAVVLKAPPGAGKSTGVPPELLRRRAAGTGQILLIQPRRLAARSVASRLAGQLRTPLGDRVGYHVRFDRRFSPQTELLVMTTGMLLRRLTNDPLLDDVSCVIIDEFHERSLEGDLALGMLQRIRTTLRPELRLMVMSATLDPAPIVGFLGDARGLTSEGRSFPVTIRYAGDDSQTPLALRIVATLRDALAATSGDILVFLPGVGEIKTTRRAIESAGVQGSASVLELYGDLAPGDQDAVLAPSRRRKIVLSTNVAETSVTIPGVTGVIDSGLARVSRFDSQVGLPKLMLEPISQASADQRAGRAGRTSPGCCWRLWSETVHRSRRSHDSAEIDRADFSSALLTLASWGENDIDDFPWLTPPRQESVEGARQLLRRLDAIDPAGRITPLGQKMVELPLHPRLARLVIAAADHGDADRAAIAAAILSERDPFPAGAAGVDDDRAPASDSSLPCDLLDKVIRVQRLRDLRRTDAKGNEAAWHTLRVADQIAKLMKEVRGGSSPEGSVEQFKRALLAAYPDRVARRRGPGDDRGLMIGGRGVRLHRASRCRDGELFLCLDVDSAGTEATVRMASTLDPAWLPPQGLRVVDEPIFQAATRSVVARRRRYFDDLLLGESPIARPTGIDAAELLYRHAATDLASVLPGEGSEANRWIERVRFLNRVAPDHQLAPLDETNLLEILRALCDGRNSFAELRDAPWLDHLRGRYDYDSLRWIDANAPAQLKLPSGNLAKVHYAPDRTPWIEAKIQELFGWPDTPRIAAGRVRLQLHLLGPNYRPEQITEDLANFWKVTYAQVRKDLRGRYPKHHWPEDPTTATATPRGMKPK